jgi:hypothetical protein
LLERAELNLQDQINNRMIVDSHIESQKKVNVG